MRLELGVFEVKQVEFASKTALADGLLAIDKDELTTLLSEEPGIQDVQIELARPGESVRIIHALDAVEPLVKVKGGSCCYPGLLGPAKTCGDGRTHRLKGLAVLHCTQFPQPLAGIPRFLEGFLDMAGPAAPFCASSDNFNVVLVLEPTKGISNAEWDGIARSAGLKVASHLARTTLGLEPNAIEIYELGPADGSLPRVVYVNQLQEQGLLVHGFVYGQHVENLLPTLIHPNEMLDGAVVSGNYKGGLRVATCIHTNNPVLKGLYRRHGRELNFLGVVLSRGHHDDHRQKERSAHYAAKVAKLIGADCALITMEGTGNTHIDFTLTVKACEEMGIKTVALLHELGGPDGTDTPLIDSVAEADAIVTVGSIDPTIAMPRVEHVIGGTTAWRYSGEIVDPYGPFECLPHNLFGAFWKMGISGMTAKDF
ncbi:MAG: hypothetical protein HY675_18565 [Chloroflexi bacterium]|nr:hypothetical protein [Chloroflexota bacterium]